MYNWQDLYRRDRGDRVTDTHLHCSRDTRAHRLFGAPLCSPMVIRRKSCNSRRFDVGRDLSGRRLLQVRSGNWQRRWRQLLSVFVAQGDRVWIVVETTRSHQFIVHGVHSSFDVLSRFHPGLYSTIKVCVYNIWCIASFFFFCFFSSLT